MFVYVIGAVGGRFIKIGVANDPVRRLGELQIGNPHDLYLSCTIECSSQEVALAIEKRFHEEYAPYRRRGEWFEFEDKKALGQIRFSAEIARLLCGTTAIVSMFHLSLEFSPSHETLKELLRRDDHSVSLVEDGRGHHYLLLTPRERLELERLLEEAENEAFLGEPGIGKGDTADTGGVYVE